jgi:probable phosphoglycerate mutase
MAGRLASSGELAGTTALLASVLPRAVETAEILAPALGRRTDEIVVDCALCELHPGAADAMIWEQYAERYGVPDWDVDPSQPIAPGGESWSGFVDRAAAALEGVAARHPGGLVVIATHAGFIESSVLRFLVGSPPDTAHRRLRLRTEHASLTEWERTEAGWRLLRYNDAYAGS